MALWHRRSSRSRYAEATLLGRFGAANARIEATLIPRRRLTAQQLPGSAGEGRARVTAVRERLLPIAGQLVERALAAGALCPDIRHQDMPVMQLMLGSVIDASREVEPELWRRYFALVLRGLRGDPTPAEPLPVGPLSEQQLDGAMRCWHPSPRR